MINSQREQIMCLLVGTRDGSPTVAKKATGSLRSFLSRRDEVLLLKSPMELRGSYAGMIVDALAREFFKVFRR